jgi:hypothetical protein
LLRRLCETVSHHDWWMCRLDGLLPRVVTLARSASDRQIKVAACELLHAIVLYILGYSYANNAPFAEQQAVCCYERLCLAVFSVCLTYSFIRLFIYIVKESNEEHIWTFVPCIDWTCHRYWQRHSTTLPANSVSVYSLVHKGNQCILNSAYISAYIIAYLLAPLEQQIREQLKYVFARSYCGKCWQSWC